MEKLTFVQAAARYLKMPGETLGDFNKELKKLTTEDRADLTRYFSESGLAEIVAAPTAN